MFKSLFNQRYKCDRHKADIIATGMKASTSIKKQLHEILHQIFEYEQTFNPGLKKTDEVVGAYRIGTFIASTTIASTLQA